MERIVMRDNSGMTLIEMLIAMLISLIVFLALMQSTLMGINTNVQNELRDEAVNVADMRMNAYMNLPFTDANLAATGFVADRLLAPATVVTRNIRSVTVNYTPTVQISNLDVNNKQVDLQVMWTWRGQAYTHIISTIVRRQ